MTTHTYTESTPVTEKDFINALKILDECLENIAQELFRALKRDSEKEVLILNSKLFNRSGKIGDSVFFSSYIGGDIPGYALKKDFLTQHFNKAKLTF